ncbi:undecaprenyl-diphosphate phosphatase [Actinomadura atramentaria]|uniref:undecaprenyl-diphosphate phosphatase n=1 Tax=Actinomadura atramentaria TaxID=1990 RepID=UPI000379A4F0|nr:undecaprenyl-diphosphate phosphatase [Actinomadura atramentaria]
MSGISVWQSVVLGVVEGLTEFLPVSSTGHLKIGEGLMGIDVGDPSVVGFTAVIQVGAIAAVLVYFRADIVRLVRAWFRGVARPAARDDHDYRLAWWIIFATIPIVVAGLLAKPLIDGPLASLWVVAASLVGGSAVLAVAERFGRRRRTEADATAADTLIIGTSQILALLFPGFSRSGATMSAGLLRGLDRPAATRLSFFLSLPALTGAGLYELKDAASGDTSVAALAVGTVVSFAVAYASIAWLLRYVAHHSFTAFIVYRLGVAAVLAGLLAAGTLSP